MNKGFIFDVNICCIGFYTSIDEWLYTAVQYNNTNDQAHHSYRDYLWNDNLTWWCIHIPIKLYTLECTFSNPHQLGITSLSTLPAGWLRCWDSHWKDADWPIITFTDFFDCIVTLNKHFVIMTDHFAMSMSGRVLYRIQGVPGMAVGLTSTIGIQLFRT